jgi:hypothetical protein
MKKTIDHYIEIVEGSTVTLSGIVYKVIKGFLIVYPNRILYLDGARLEKISN